MELIDRKSPGTAVRRCFIGSDGFSICLRISMTLEWFMFKEETLYRRAPSRHSESEGERSDVLRTRTL